jgi:hypothetical protein
MGGANAMLLQAQCNSPQGWDNSIIDLSEFLPWASRLYAVQPVRSD